MLSRCKDAVACHAREYKDALSGFTHNARRFLVSGFLQGLGGGMLATVFGIFIKTAGMGEHIVGNVEAAVAFAAAMIALLGTPLVSRLGYRVMMVASIVLIVASRFVMAAFPGAAVLVGLSLVVGLGDGFLRCIGSAFMSHNSGSDERAHLFSVEFLVRVSAGFLGGLAGGLMPTYLQHFVSELTSYQWTIAAGATLLGLGILPMLTLRETIQPAASKIRHAYRDSLKGFTQWRRLAKLVGPQAAISLGGGMVIPFVPLYLKHSLGASIGQIGAILGFSSVVTAVGAFATPAIARKLGLPTGVALLQGLSVPFLAAVSLSGSLPLAIAALWIRGALMNMAGPMFNQLSMEGVSDHEKPIIAGGMFFGLNMMWLLGNVIGGHLMEVSYALPYVAAVCLYATGAGLTYAFWRNYGKAVPAATPVGAEGAVLAEAA